MFSDILKQRGQTGHPRDISDPRPHVTRPTKLFFNLLLVTTSFFIVFTPKDFKRKCRVFYFVCCFTYKCSTHTVERNQFGIEQALFHFDHVKHEVTYL
jgi:hypothetical protein